MRDPKRIGEILSLIEEVWGFDKDLRFLQLMHILEAKYDFQNGGYGKVEEENDGFTRSAYDLFNVEDDRFIKFLKEYLIELKSRA